MALRFQSNYDFTDVPIPTTSRPSPPQPSGNTIRRAKTLTKPERGVAPVPLINPPSHAADALPTIDDYNGSSTWRLFSHIVTFWAPAFLLSSVGGLKDKAVQQAWREKITLCVLIAIMCALVGFVTVGFQKVLCPLSNGSESIFLRVGTSPGTLSILGQIYNATDVQSTPSVNFNTFLAVSGSDITPLFQRDASLFSDCQNLNFRIALDAPCSSITPCPLGPLNASSTYESLNLIHTQYLAGYSWTQVAQLTNYIVIDGSVINLNPYISIHPNPIPGDTVDKAIRAVLDPSQSGGGKDASRLFLNRQDLSSAIPCIQQRYGAGNIDKITPGCFASSLLLYAGLIVILGLVLVRFAMACVFNWFLSERLAGPPSSQTFNRSAISPVVMPEGANISVDNKMGTAPWAATPAHPKKLNKQQAKSRRSIASASSQTLVNSYGASTPIMSLAQIGAELFAVCLVTCYSEGEESLRTTLDSISATDYSDARKLLFVVADGMITGAGEKRSTPDICVALLDADPRFGNPIPMSYSAVGSGAKGQNRAMVYAGHYSKLVCLSTFFYSLSFSCCSPSHSHYHHCQMWDGG